MHVASSSTAGGPCSQVSPSIAAFALASSRNPTKTPLVATPGTDTPMSCGNIVSILCNTRECHSARLRRKTHTGRADQPSSREKPRDIPHRVIYRDAADPGNSAPAAPAEIRPPGGKLVPDWAQGRRLGK